ncbi:hypothetical protein LPJ66_007314, partial [Kickxella alabastrina]
LDDKERTLALLERLQKEDDENIDMWYLYGWTYYLQSEEPSAGAEEKVELLSSARECFKQAIKLAAIFEFENDGLIDHARELVAAIDSVVLSSADDENIDNDQDPAAGANGAEEWDDIVSENEDDDDVEMGA